MPKEAVARFGLGDRPGSPLLRVAPKQHQHPESRITSARLFRFLVANSEINTIEPASFHILDMAEKTVQLPSTHIASGS